MSDNRRRLARASVNQSVLVLNALRNTEVGKLVNLHEEGFLVIGARDIKHNGIYQLKLQLSVPINGVSEISLGAECLWMSETGGEDQYWAGFHIIDLSQSDKPIISQIMSDIAEE